MCGFPVHSLEMFESLRTQTTAFDLVRDFMVLFITLSKILTFLVKVNNKSTALKGLEPRVCS